MICMTQNKPKNQVKIARNLQRVITALQADQTTLPLLHQLVLNEDNSVHFAAGFFDCFRRRRRLFFLRYNLSGLEYQ